MTFAAGRVIAPALAAGIGISVVAQFGTFAQSPPPAPNAPAPAPDLSKVYMPGLGEFMLVIQTHHAKLWHAAKAKNWPLAQYQLSEMKEVMDEVRELVPTYKNLPVGDMIDAVAVGPIGELEKAVEQKNLRSFTSAYSKLTAACNDCHKAASRSFIQIRTPTRSTFDNEEFRPPRR